jgi:hypothetical protein
MGVFIRASLSWCISYSLNRSPLTDKVQFIHKSTLDMRQGFKQKNEATLNPTLAYDL